MDSKRLRWGMWTAAATMLVACGDDSGRGGATASGSASIGSISDGSGSADDGDGDGPPADAELSYLQVDPAETILEIDIGATDSIDYTVTAVYTDGSTIDVTADVSWTVDNPAVGAMSGATLQVPAFPDSTFVSSILSAEVDGEVGQAQVTIAAYRLSEDFFFVLPFEDPAGDQSKPLTFSTDVKSMDVFVSMDTTGSMGGALSNLQNALASSIIPGIQALVPDTQFGAGTFEDFPVSPYGASPTDQPFELFAAITPDAASVSSAVLAFQLGNGGDGPESNFEALYQIATGEGLVGPAPTNVPNNAGLGIGGVGFREGSFPIVVSISDAVSHDTADNSCGQQYSGAVAGVAHSRQQTVDALNGICARVVQIATNSAPTCSVYADGVALADATGALVPPEAWDVAGHPAGCAAGQCCTGLNGAGQPPNAQGMCPMVYVAQFNGTGVDTSFSSAIELLAQYGQFNVTSQVSGGTTDVDGQALPAGTTTADFIKAVTPAGHGPVPLPGVPDPTLGPTSIDNVIPNTDVMFDVVAYNDFLEPVGQPRLFVATIDVLADDCGDLDTRDVFILVPPAKLPPPG